MPEKQRNILYVVINLLCMTKESITVTKSNEKGGGLNTAEKTQSTSNNAMDCMSKYF